MSSSFAPDVPDAAAVAGAVARLRARKPLVQCIPNVVAAEITANVLLAAGAAPAMVIGIEEAPDFARNKATALSINCGALTAPALASMRAAAAAASSSERRPAWVLDPVACGGTEHRTAACRELLALGPRVIRGNASEVLSIASAQGANGPRGVDASDAAEAALPAAAALARAHGGMVVVITGPTDYVTDGTDTLAVRGGAAEVTQVTGTGCALSALVVAFVSLDATPSSRSPVGDTSASSQVKSSQVKTSLGPVGYAAACCAFYKACASVAARDCPGPGSFKVRLLDALAMPQTAIAAAVEPIAIWTVAIPQLPETA